MEQAVKYVHLAFQTRQRYLADRYQFREDKGWHWLQRLAIWVLKKLGCGAFIMEEAMVRQGVINTEKLVEQIIEQRVDTLNWYHHHGERLLVGPGEFNELMGLPFDHPLSLILNYCWAGTDEEQPWNTKITRCGLTVTIIPHMKGVLMLPKGWDK